MTRNPERALKDKRILVIDDEAAIRKSFVLALEDTEYSVDTAESGEKGIEKERENHYDLIFLDLNMPGLNGVETLRILRSIDDKVPVYIVTAFYHDFLHQLKDLENEIINFELIQKPIGQDQIVLAVKSILEGPITF